MGFRAGASLHSAPTNGVSFDAGYALGGDLHAGAFVLGPHRVRISVGFLDSGLEREKGTPEIRVKTDYARFEFAAGYDFTWRLLVAGAHVGYALAINRVVTTFGEPTWSAADGGIAYEEPQNAETRDRVGVDGGLLVGLTVGVELGELFGFTDLLELCARGDYTIRNGRNEITVVAAVAFWPTAFKNGKK